MITKFDEFIINENTTNDYEKYIDMLIKNDFDNEELNTFYTLPTVKQKEIMDIVKQKRNETKKHKTFTDFIYHTKLKEYPFNKFKNLPLAQLKDLLKENEILLKDEESRSFGNSGVRERIKNIKEKINTLESIINAHKQADDYNKN